MAGMVQAKICGLSTPEAVRAALDGGAAYLGFIFFAKSPRNVDAGRRGAPGRARPGQGRQIVAVTVDPVRRRGRPASSPTLRPDLIQLHGKETPARAAEIRARAGAGVIKALSGLRRRPTSTPPRAYDDARSTT